jgi:uncharacterized spore protein YtfJ
MEMLERVADKLGMHAGASAAFGEPVERDGVTVIPVTQLIIGTGGGGGTSPDAESGIGAGGGAVTRPLGYIEIGAQGARYVPFQPSWLNPGVLLTVIVLVLIGGRTLVRLRGA